MTDDLMMALTDRAGLTRRSFVRLGAAASVAAVTGSLTVAHAFAREAESGDDRGGHGADDAPEHEQEHEQEHEPEHQHNHKRKRKGKR